MRIFKTLICLALFVSFMLSFISCDIFTKDELPEGYTGGFTHPYGAPRITEVHWVETYEEAAEILSHLEAAGTPISNRSLFIDYENEYVDAKYCIGVNIEGLKKTKDDVPWYDRTYNRVNVVYYGFLEDVTIEEIEYSYVSVYKHILVTNPRQREVPPLESIACVCDGIGAGSESEYFGYGDCYFIDEESGVAFIKMVYNNVDDHVSVLPEDFHEEFIKAIVDAVNK